MPVTHPSVCRFCHAGCAILVDVEDGRPVRVRGDRDDPVYRGFTCEKGRQLPQQHTHPDRLLTAMRRMPDGTHQPVASGQAFDEIAERVRAILDEHGPRSVATYCGTCASRNPAARPMMNAWMDAIGSPMRFDSNTIDQPGKSVALALHGRWGAPPHGFDDARVALLIGVNPFVTLAGALPTADPVRRLHEARARGLQLLVVDPRRTETARAADVHVQPRPGEDVAIVAALLHVIVREGWYDRAFVDDHVQGFEALRRAVEPFTPGMVAARADVDAGQLADVARRFATAGRGVAGAGTGPSMTGAGSTLLEYLVLALNTVCGRYLRAGERLWNPGVMIPQLANRAQATSPWPAYGYGERLRVRDLADAACGLSTAALADEILLEGEGRVRALFCLGGNPVAAWPDRDRTWRAMQSLDLLVTLDIKMSATAKAAHYVIAPRLTLEVPGSTYVAEALYYYAIGFGLPVPYARYAPAVVDPPPGADVVEEWQLFHGLGQRMGLQLGLLPAFPRPDEEPWRLDMQDPPDLETLMAFLYRNARVPFDEVRRHPRGAVFDSDPVYVEPADPGWTGRLDVGNAEMLAELAEHAVASPSAADDDAYPFRLVCRRHVGALNSSGLDLPRMQSRPYNPAFLHPDDLTAAGLEPGDAVELRSASGTLVAVVDADPSLRRGLVSMTHAYGDVPGTEASFRRTGSNTSALVQVDTGYDRFTGMPRMSNVPVQLVPAPAAPDAAAPDAAAPTAARGV